MKYLKSNLKLKIKYIILLGICTLVKNAAHSQDIRIDSNQLDGLSKTIGLMMEIDPSLDDIELFYGHLKEDAILKKWVSLKFNAPKRRIEELSKNFSNAVSNRNPAPDIAGFLPPRWLIDSIPVPCYDPNTKKFVFDIEHAETLHQLKGLKEEVFAKLEENGLKYQPKGNYGGEQELIGAEKSFGFNKNSLLIVETLLEKVINQATAEIIESTSIAARDATDERESNSEVKKQIRAARITRAILLRLCNEKALQMEIEFWMKSKHAFSQVLETFYNLKSAQASESKESKIREADVAKGIIQRADGLLYRSRWLQNRAQVIIRTFDMFIDQSRLNGQ